MDEERKEDLNPRGDEIEEKVRKMMDLTVPDEPASVARTTPKKPAKSSTKPPTLQAVSVPVTDAADQAIPSAPELPAPDKSAKKANSTSKKVIIPINDDSQETTALRQPAKDVAPTPGVKKITIAEGDESTAEIAEKLDEAIADLAEPSTDIVQELPDTVDSTDMPDNDNPESESLEPPPEEPLIADPEVITARETDKAVEDIVAKESDELLEVEDAVRDTDEPVKPAKKPRRKLRQLLKDLWAKRGVRRVVVGCVLLAVFVVLAVPTSRYFVFNAVGVRASSSLTVLDDSTQQPLKNVKVSAGGTNNSTDEAGRVQLRHAKLGSTVLVIEKRAFAPVQKRIILGWGSNPLGDFRLAPTGTQYTFTVKDFLSDKPRAKAQAESGDANAVSDDKGVIKLTVEKPAESKLTVSIMADGYRREELTIDPDDKSNHQVKLVPTRKEIFVSKRSGKFDIYSVYIDGKDEKLVLAGSGHEREDMILVSHPTDNIAAFVSTRADQHNSDGYLLSNLILINLEDNTTTSIVAAERIQLVSFSGDHLVYVQIVAGASANNPKRYRLMSYNYKDDTNKELASSNYFNDVIAAGGAIYYAPSSAYQTGKTNFLKVDPNGENLQTIHSEEVWNTIRTAYDHLALSVQQNWFDYRLGDKAATKLNSAPANQTSRTYLDNPDGKKSLWIDNRDGKGTLQLYDISTKLDKTLKSQSGLSYPVRWLSDSVITYRIKSAQETADYALSLDGGEPVKIRDVTNVAGISK